MLDSNTGKGRIRKKKYIFCFVKSLAIALDEIVFHTIQYTIQSML